MNTILKKTLRRETRVQVKGGCIVSTSQKSQKHVVDVYDISLGGICFSCKEPLFQTRTVLQIQLRKADHHPLTIQGKVIKGPEVAIQGDKQVFRYSIRFEQKLMEQQFIKVLEAYELQSDNSESVKNSPSEVA